MLGCGPDGPLGPLDGGQMGLLRLLDNGQKGILSFWTRARIARKSLKCKIKAHQILHFLLVFAIKVLDWGLPNG